MFLHPALVVYVDLGWLANIGNKDFTTFHSFHEQLDLKAVPFS